MGLVLYFGAAIAAMAVGVARGIPLLWMAGFAAAAIGAAVVLEWP